ncbi:MAG: hypothetical protein JSV93_01825 [Candidatus Omnitrophota bacterium]|nr:MAG: hypothetical protein JSV93_01825 [Candidatus Omnitrophota bacterium]
MFTFSIVKKTEIKESINRDIFVIERIRKERALNNNKYKNKIFTRNEKLPPS